jgi:hypothetical protein
MMEPDFSEETIMNEVGNALPIHSLPPIEQRETKLRRIKRRAKWAAGEEAREDWTPEMFAEEEERLHEEIASFLENKNAAA